MRRQDKEIKNPAEVEALLSAAMVCRIGLTDGRTPYIVPVHFALRGGRMYIHSAREGKKLDLLRANDQVCFETDAFLGTVSSPGACQWTSRYESVLGFGRASVVADLAERREAMNLLMAKYTGRTSWNYPEEALARVAIIRIDVAALTGKRSALPPAPERTPG